MMPKSPGWENHSARKHISQAQDEFRGPGGGGADPATATGAPQGPPVCLPAILPP